MNSAAANTNAGETQTITTVGKLTRIENLTDRFGQVEIGHSATILPGDSLVISGFEKGRVKRCQPHDPSSVTPYERTFAIGDMCRYGGMNIDYIGMITSITAKIVTIKDGSIVKRLTIADFARKNRFFSLEASQRRNAEWLD